MDHLDADELVITKLGKPMARVVPAGTGCKDLIGSLAGKMKFNGTIESTGIEWEAAS